jgi:hypothetical protein
VRESYPGFVVFVHVIIKIILILVPNIYSRFCV